MARAAAGLGPRRAIDQMRNAGGGSGSSGMWERKDAGGAGGGRAARLMVRPEMLSATRKLNAAWPWLPWCPSSWCAAGS